jgi:hypothetical protein
MPRLVDPVLARKSRQKLKGAQATGSEERNRSKVLSITLSLQITLPLQSTLLRSC